MTTERRAHWGRAVFTTAKTNRERVLARLETIRQTGKYWECHVRECEGPHGVLLFELSFLERTDQRTRVLHDAMAKITEAVGTISIYGLTAWLQPLD